LISLSLSDISSKRVSSFPKFIGSPAGSEGKAESGGEKTCGKTAAKSQQERHCAGKVFLFFMVHALFQRLGLGPNRRTPD
jgi:hypothetical protein